MIDRTFISCCNDLVAVQTEIIATVLRVRARPLESMPADAYDDVALAAEVRVFGAWEGKIAVCMSVVLARAIAAAMWGLPVEEVSDETALDAVREVANITAGGIKAALLPPPTDMSTPANIAATWEALGHEAASNGAVAYFRVDTSYLAIALTPGAAPIANSA
jgi:CheY-specific phosphatase CheX